MKLRTTITFVIEEELDHEDLQDEIGDDFHELSFAQLVDHHEARIARNPDDYINGATGVVSTKVIA